MYTYNHEYYIEKYIYTANTALVYQRLCRKFNQAAEFVHDVQRSSTTSPHITD